MVQNVIFSNLISPEMKLGGVRYGEYFQGRISTYPHQRPVFIHFLECIEKETPEVWRVDFYPRHGLTPGTVLAIKDEHRNVLCEITGWKSSGRFVRMLDTGIDLMEIWKRNAPAIAEA